MSVSGTMKGPATKEGKRHTAEAKLRALREAGGGRPIREVCPERDSSGATCHRGRQQFGLMAVDEARRWQERERADPGLKKLLAEARLQNRVREAVCERKLCARRRAGDARRGGPLKRSARGARRAGSCGWPAQPAGAGGNRRVSGQGRCVNGGQSCPCHLPATVTGGSPRCGGQQAGRPGSGRGNGGGVTKVRGCRPRAERPPAEAIRQAGRRRRCVAGTCGPGTSSPTRRSGAAPGAS